MPSGIRLPIACAVAPASALISISFGSVIEKADADVVEAEILLNLSDDLSQHVDRVIAGNGGARNVVEECELAGAPLFLRRRDGHSRRRQRSLTGGSGNQNVQVTLFVHEFAFRVHGNHDACGFITQEDGCCAKAFGRIFRSISDALDGCESFPSRSRSAAVDRCALRTR